MFKTTIVQLDHERLPLIMDEARAKCPKGTRWRRALEKGYEWLIEQDTVEMTDDGSVLVPSASDPDLLYHSNGVCTCAAYLNHTPAIPCWHRAAARLVELMLAPAPRQIDVPTVQQRIAFEEANDEIAERLRKRQAYEQALAEVDELFAR